jgi:hypothetical protein
VGILIVGFDSNTPNWLFAQFAAFVVLALPCAVLD